MNIIYHLYVESFFKGTNNCINKTEVIEVESSQGQGGLVGCRLWGHTESDMTEVT